MTQRSLREQIAAGQERLALIREDHQAATAEAERNRSMTRKTPYGDRVPKAEDLGPLADALDGLYEFAAECLEEINKAEQRSADIQRAAAERATGRFPALGGGA